jgi:hypothetical protein
MAIWMGAGALAGTDFGMTEPQRPVALSAAVLLFLIATGAATAQTTTVFVPGNTLGYFGNPSVDGNQPYVTGIVATGPERLS